MVTIKDIAQAANVSAMTVSNVIHGRTKKVSKETKERIEQIMEEMQYVPNMGARMLVQNESRIIGGDFPTFCRIQSMRHCIIRLPRK